MPWLFGCLTLVAIALSLRRILHMGAANGAQGGGLGFLRGEQEAIYKPLAQEIEAQATILGITLNEAFNERSSERIDMAWHMVGLARKEWERLAELLVGLQSILFKFLPVTTGIFPLRRVAAHHFKSRTVMDNVGMYEFLDQLLFSSKRRYALQLRFLFRASAVLTKDFKRACREGEFALDSSNELWGRLDYYFHDFDLIAKETLLAFRTLLLCQPAEVAQELAYDLQALLERGTCVSISPPNQ